MQSSDVIFQNSHYRYRPIPNFLEIGRPIYDRLSLSPKFPDILPIFHFCYIGGKQKWESSWWADR